MLRHGHEAGDGASSQGKASSLVGRIADFRHKSVNCHTHHVGQEGCGQRGQALLSANALMENLQHHLDRLPGRAADVPPARRAAKLRWPMSGCPAARESAVQGHDTRDFVASCRAPGHLSSSPRTKHAPEVRYRRAHRAPSRLRLGLRSASGRGGVRLDEDHRRAAQTPLPRPRAGADARLLRWPPPTTWVRRPSPPSHEADEERITVAGAPSVIATAQEP